MFGALIIVFREVIEAGLIIGIVLAATRGVNGRGRWVATGILAGTLGAGIVALFAEAIANAFEGSGQELLNAGVLGTAVVMLMWHAAWMARHGREMAIEMAAVGAGSPGYIVALALPSGQTLQTTTTTLVSTSLVPGPTTGIDPTTFYVLTAIAVVLLLATGVLAVKRRRPAS